jgi:A/G-specific adenine glycosylase
MTRALRRKLLAWYDRARRDLPWRRTKDPYSIWVSEVMLQQTRVEAVLPYYARFLREFPTVGALARAPLDRVLGAWAGLGYYRRARLLHAAAGEVVRCSGGVIPSDSFVLRELPGVGRYTAGAIASIAFGLPEPVVDGNVARVLSRLGAVGGDPRMPSVARKLESMAATLVAGERPGDLNQALMELGACVCVPHAPRCPLCPVKPHCEARRLGRQNELPAPRRERAPVAVRHAAAVIRRRGRFLLVRRGERDLMAGLHEFPTVEVPGGGDPLPRLAAYVRRRIGLVVDLARPVARVRHSITYRRIALEAFEAHPRSGRAGPPATWLTARSARARGLTAAARKILDAVCSR